jgi:hypothetical protein
MSDSIQNLRAQLHGAVELSSVERGMKTKAAFNIGQCEAVVLSLRAHASTVAQGLAGPAPS